MAKAKLGSGKRFKAGASKLEKKGYSKKYADAVMAKAGRKKYGKKAFQSMAAKGRKKK
jgi:hypothetical protein